MQLQVESVKKYANKAFIQLKRLLQNLSPPLPVGGLWISDSVIRFFLYKEGGGTVHAALRLSPGIIEQGRVKDKERLRSALAELRRQLVKHPRQKLYVVLTLPISDVYIQTFTLPPVAAASIGEAAELNMRMISPMNPEEAYMDWQELQSAGQQPVLLGAFVRREVVDALTAPLEEAGFSLAAVEFASLSLVRQIQAAGVIDKATADYIAIEVTSEGTSFVIAVNSTPRFHYFHPWSELQGGDKTVSLEKFQKVLAEETRRILNFYGMHWSGRKLVDAVVVTPALGEEIASFLASAFPDLKVHVAAPDRASAVAGAALRGKEIRLDDTAISLADVTTVQVFQYEQLINFVRLWRNAFFTTAGFLLVLFIASSVFARRAATRAVAESAAIFNRPEAAELQLVEKKAVAFNEQVAALERIANEGKNLSPLARRITEIAGDDIVLERLAFSLEGRNVLVNGRAPNERSAVAFKDRLRADSHFSGVDLPIRNVTVSGGGVSFTMNFRVESLDF